MQPPTPLELSDAELDNITTGKLIIGRDDASAAGTITVSQVVSLALLAAPVVVLITGAKIDDTVAGSISPASWLCDPRLASVRLPIR